MKNKIDSVSKSISSLKKTIKDKYLLIGILISIQGANLNLIDRSSGLDPSWSWLTVQAFRQNWFEGNKYIFNYGPLHFLDAQNSGWPVGQVLSAAFRLIVAFIFTFKLMSFLKRQIASDIIVLLTTYSWVTFSFLFLPPSSVLVQVIILVYFANIKRLSIVFIWSGISVFTLLIKPLTGGLIATILFFLVYSMYRQVYIAIVNTVSVIGFYICILILYGANPFDSDGFIRGQFEMVWGFSSMAREEAGRLWEYPAFAILTAVILYILKFNGDKVQLLMILCLLFIVGKYGFVRHDGHSVATFTYVCFIILILCISYKVKGTAIFNVFSVIILFIVSNVNLVALLDPTVRIMNIGQYIKSTDPRYYSNLNNERISFLQSQYPLRDDFVAEISTNSVSVQPYDQLVAAGYSFKIATPPVPQPYSAYTPFLDNVNAKYYSNVMISPKYILFSRPTAIDGRNFSWESPKAMLSIVCNYAPQLYDEHWLLLKKKENQACDFGKSTPINKQSELENASIVTFDIEFSKSASLRIFETLFKPLRAIEVQTATGNWRIVHTNPSNMIAKVPEDLQWPSYWRFQDFTKARLPDSFDGVIRFKVTPLRQ